MQTITEDIGVGQSIAEKWAAVKGQPLQTLRTVTNDRDPRYLWYPGEDIPWHITELPGGFIERCRVTPILAAPVWEPFNDVPEVMQIDTRSEDGKVVEARYEIQPGQICKSILDKYGIWGVTELRSLKGMPLDQFMHLQIDDIFTPWPKDRNRIDPKTNKPLDRCPKAYKELREHIVWVAKQIKDSGTVTIYGSTLDLTDRDAAILYAVAEDMVLAIQHSESYDVALVDREESGEHPQYSVHGLRCLDRLGRRRRDAALNDMAAVQNQVIAQLPALIAQQQQPTSAQDMATFATSIADAITKNFASILAQFQTAQAQAQAAPSQAPLIEPEPAPQKQPSGTKK